MIVLAQHANWSMISFQWISKIYMHLKYVFDCFLSNQYDKSQWALHWGQL